MTLRETRGRYLRACRFLSDKAHERVTCLSLLCGVIAFSLVNNVIWLRIDTRPPRWDEAHYLTMSLKYHEALSQGGLAAFAKALLVVDLARPPLVPALAVPAYLLFGRSADGALVVNLLAFIMLILVVYGLGARLASPWVGLLAAFFVSTYPGIYGLSRLFYLDFFNTALVAAALYLIVRTTSFSRIGPSVALGAVIGLGLLCRAFFPVFVIAPLVVCVYSARKESRSGMWTGEDHGLSFRANAGLVLLLSAAVAGPWYLVNLVPLARRSLSAAFGAEAVGYGPSEPLSPRAILSYLIIFIDVHTTLFGMILFLLATALLLVKRPVLLSQVFVRNAKTSHGVYFLLSSVLPPLMVFSVLPSQDPKNIAPVLPAVAVISSWGVSLLGSDRLKKALIGFAVVVSLLQFCLGTYGVPPLPEAVGLRVGSQLPDLLVYRQATANPDEAFHLLPRRENWRMSELLSRIAELPVRPNGAWITAKPAILAIIPDHALFNSNNFYYVAVLKGLSLQVEHPGDPRSPEGRNYRTQLLRVDYAVMKTGDPGPAWVNPFNMEMVEFLRSNESGFVEVPPHFPLPDGSEAILYARHG